MSSKSNTLIRAHTPKDIKGGGSVEKASTACYLPLACKVAVCTVLKQHIALRYAGVGACAGNTEGKHTSCDASRAVRQSTGTFMTPLNVSMPGSHK